MRAIDLENGMRTTRMSNHFRQIVAYAYTLQSQPQERLLLGVGKCE